MRSFRTVAYISAILVLVSGVSARADDFGKRFTLNLVPTYIASGTGDSTAKPPPGYTAVGYTNASTVSNPCTYRRPMRLVLPASRSSRRPYY